MKPNVVSDYKVCIKFMHAYYYICCILWWLHEHSIPHLYMRYCCATPQAHVYGLAFHTTSLLDVALIRIDT